MLMFGISHHRLAFNKLHCQEKFASLGNTAINQFGDVRVIQRGEDLAFASKVSFEIPIGETLPNDLQSNLFLKFAVGALGQEYSAHAAAPDLPQDAIGTKALAVILLAVCLQLRSKVDRMLFKQGLRFFVGCE